MKKAIFYHVIILLCIFSCSKKDYEPSFTYPVSFGFSIGNQSGRISSQPDHVIISIEDSQGSQKVVDKVIDLTPFGNSFISSSIELEEGSYFLTSFVVVNDQGEVIYVSPMEGSEKSYLVNHPLPISFQVTANELNTVDPEVLSVLEQDSPAEFGYVAFGFDVVNTFGLNIAVISDLDGSFVASEVVVKGYNDTDELVLEKVIVTDNSNEVAVDLLSDVARYTFELNQAGFHPLSYFFETSDLVSLASFSMIASSTDHSFAIQVSDDFKGLDTNPQHIFLYFPKNGCDADFRIDFGSISASTVDLTLSVYNSDLTISEITDELFQNSTNGGIYGLGSFSESDNRCLNYPPEEDLIVEKSILATYSIYELQFTTLWDETNGLWISTEQVIYSSQEQDPIFHEIYDLNN